LNEVQRRDMAVQAASGLVFLHQHLCLHWDVVARNVLLTAMSRSLEDLPPCGYVLKLSDLGMTRTLREEGDYYRVCCQGRRGCWGVGVGVGELCGGMSNAQVGLAHFEQHNSASPFTTQQQCRHHSPLQSGLIPSDCSSPPVSDG
jgi:serine/threonine protein kinase